MRAPLWQVDAFTQKPFAGNPAAVCLLDAYPDNATLQAIATENNLSETAYLVPQGNDFQIRWFTPGVEVELCGHATLASGHVVLTVLEPDRSDVTFHSPSGPLGVKRTESGYVMDFPARPSEPVDPPENLVAALGQQPTEVRRTRDDDYLCVYPDQPSVENLAPDFRALGEIGARGISVTARGNDCDFVSRFFAPASGIDEDPVTGSAHCALTPYWSARLDKARLTARQLSARGGEVGCEIRGDRVLLSGSAVSYLRGEIGF